MMTDHQRWAGPRPQLSGANDTHVNTASLQPDDDMERLYFPAPGPNAYRSPEEIVHQRWFMILNVNHSPSKDRWTSILEWLRARQPEVVSLPEFQPLPSIPLTWYVEEARAYGFDLHHPPGSRRVGLLTNSAAVSVAETVVSRTGRVVSIRAHTASRPSCSWYTAIYGSCLQDEQGRCRNPAG